METISIPLLVKSFDETDFSVEIHHDPLSGTRWARIWFWSHGNWNVMEVSRDTIRILRSTLKEVEKEF